MASQTNNPVADALRAEANEIANVYTGGLKEVPLSMTNAVAMLIRVANKIDAGKRHGEAWQEAETRPDIQEQYDALWERHRRLQDSEYRLIKSIRWLITWRSKQVDVSRAEQAISESVLENGGYQITK